ncbi:hypothetical protein [Ralstonia pseudosolanacearum]|uniref:hypothetical protein n=1 Tax=Ralstonia pseudosolanacearum TaxID=1310165 RepID=UPI003CF43A74
MTVGMQNRVAGKCGSAAMAAGDVFGCERAACLWRGEARILGGQTAPSVVGAKKRFFEEFREPELAHSVC